MNGIQVITSPIVPPGTMILGADLGALDPGKVVVMSIHPLDQIAIKHEGDPLGRLDAAMAWIFDRARRNLDALVAP